MVLVGLCVAFLFLYGERIAYVALYAVLILPALSLLYTVAAVWGLKAEHGVDSDRVIRNDEIVYKVAFTNKGWLPVFCARVVLLREGEVSPFEVRENSKIVSVMQWRKVEVGFPLTCLYRGIFSLQAEKIEVMDVLGLFNFKLNIEKPLEVTVFPALTEIKNVPLSAANISDAPSIRETTDEDYAVITDLRRYLPEDSFKRVHWKMSAKKNELMVKSFQAVNLNSAVLVLNNRNLPFDRPHTDLERIAVEDKLAECVISFAHYSLLRRFPVELYYMNDGLKWCAEGSYSGFSNLYNICAGIEFNNPPDFLRNFKDIVQGQEDFVNLVVFTPEIGRALCDEIRSAKVMGHNLIVVYVETRREGSFPSLDMEIRQMLVEMGVVVYYLAFDEKVGDGIG